MYKLGEQEALDLLKKEMEAAGVDYIVIPGREASSGPKAVDPSGKMSMIVSAEMLVGLRTTFDNRAFGLYGLDLTQPTDKIVAGLEEAVKKYGLSGAVMEPVYFTEPDGSPLWADNKKLYPIYEAAIDLDVFLMHQSGIYAGAVIWVNNWAPLDRVMQDLPALKVLLAHGGYPAVVEALALVTKHANLYISPDIYCLFPGGKTYIGAISMLPDQFIYASAYPLGPLKNRQT
jgi:hypothetical protein